MVADHGRGARLGAGVGGGALAENVVVADLQIGRGARLDRVVLRRLAECGKRMDHIAGAERGVSVDVAVADQAGARADPDVGTDVAEGADFDAVVENRAVCDDAGGMDLRHMKNLSIWFD